MTPCTAGTPHTLTPAYDMGGVRIFVGHVLDVLAEMEPGSVQTVVTSPPYYGLRAYSTDPQVWGGDPSCSHTLEETAPGKVLTGGTGTASAKQVSNAGSQYGNQPGWSDKSGLKRDGRPEDSRLRTILESPKRDTQPGIVKSTTCTRCGAWRGELGSEPTPDCLAWARGQEPCGRCYVCHIVAVFRAVRRVLHDTGTIWVNLGDSYSGSGKGPTGHNGIGDQGRRQGFVDQRSDVSGLGPKQLMMMPARVALALQADGWVLRQQIIWAKPNPMPESVTDRCTTAHEYVYLLSKRADYYYDAEAIKEPGVEPERERLDRIGGANGHTVRHSPGALIGATATRNRRSVWTIPTESFSGAHFATFARKLVEPCVLAGTSARGQCPACGAPWRRVVARERTPHGYRSPSRNGVADGWTTHHTQNAGMDPHHEVSTTTLGWAPTCRCDAGDPVPQTVLDPFAGSGTTLAVARWHQRRAVGIELNPEYAKLAAGRLKQGVLPLVLL